MEILSKKIDVPSPQAIPEASSSEPMENSLFNLLFQNSLESSQPVKSTELSEMMQANADDKLTDGSQENIDAPLVNPLLTQIINPIPSQPEKPQTTIEKQLGDELAISNTVIDNSNTSIKNTINEPTSPEEDAPNEFEALLSETKAVTENIPRSLPQLNNKDEIKPEVPNTPNLEVNETIALTLNDNQKPNLNDNNKLIDKINKSKTSQPFPINDIQSAKADSVDQTASAQFIQSLVAPKEKILSQDTNSNKYTEALSALGGVINNLTTQQGSSDSATPPITIKTEPSLVTDSKPSLLDHEIKIDIMPPTAGALANEAYTAKIKIYPPELGHVLAKLKTDKNGTELVIMTENNRVKEIVEANLPQLREHFLQADINLTSVQVQSSLTNAQDQPGREGKPQSQTQAEKNFNEINQSSTPLKDEPQRRRVLDSIIDTYI